MGLMAGGPEVGATPRVQLDARTKGEASVAFLVGSQVAGRYHTLPTAAKPYWWPLIAPSGVMLTRGWPMEKPAPGGSTDHVHQKSAWFGHGDVIGEGIAGGAKGKGGVDFWSEGPGHGQIISRTTACDANGVPARIANCNEWRTAVGLKILDETRFVELVALNHARLFVVDIDLYASVCPVTFGDTKEGTLGVRVNDRLRVQSGGIIRNADGKVGERACWGRRSAWCDYSGVIDGKPAGITVLDDPRNPYPACWHCRGYGLLAANPFGRARSGFPDVKGRTDLVKLAKGEHLKLRYGLLLHDGDVESGGVADCYSKFVKLRGVD
jgi:hypothetical protein